MNGQEREELIRLFEDYDLGSHLGLINEIGLLIRRQREEEGREIADTVKNNLRGSDGIRFGFNDEAKQAIDDLLAERYGKGSDGAR